MQADVGTEHWCGVLQEVGIPGCGADPVLFMAAAKRFANERCVLKLLLMWRCHHRHYLLRSLAEHTSLADDGMQVLGHVVMLHLHPA